MAKELYVGHISEQATEEDLRKLFSLMGPVTSVHLIVDQQTGEFKRCGYVRMLSEVNLDEVVETLDGTYLIDRCIVVSVAKPQKDRPAKTASVRRKPLAAQPAGARDPKHKAGREAGTGSRPVAAKESAKTGRSSAAKESARFGRSPVSKDFARGERPAPAGRAQKGGRSAAAEKGGTGSRPAPKGRK